MRFNLFLIENLNNIKKLTKYLQMIKMEERIQHRRVYCYYRL